MALVFPRTFLLPTHLQDKELHALEDQIASLTYDIKEAEIVVGKITRRERALFELRRFKLETEPVQSNTEDEPATDAFETPSPKRRKVSNSRYEANASDGESLVQNNVQGNDVIKVVKLAWLMDSLDQGVVLPVDLYVLYEGRKIYPKGIPSREPSLLASPIITSSPTSGVEILKRAVEDQSGRLPSNDTSPKSRYQRSHVRSSPLSQRPKLPTQTTSEHDIALPLIPEFLTTTYSCQRPTPVNGPNDEFIEALKNIRTIRLLHGDQIGVRAYSTSIATLAAYPYTLQNPEGRYFSTRSCGTMITCFTEVARLPGCGTKIAELYQQWKSSGRLNEAIESEADSNISVLKVFYEIWGVGDTTAREFYRKGKCFCQRSNLKLTNLADARMARLG